MATTTKPRSVIASVSERLTCEALADVDAGRVIDHQAVQAWADSLSTDTPLPAPRSMWHNRDDR